jgi:signal transduction histidine kinase
MELFVDKTICIEKIAKKINDIRDECNLSLMTLNSVSVFEHDVGQYEFSLTDIFTDIIAKVRKMLNPIATAEKNISIIYNNEINMPKLYIDKYRMQLVFHNLLLNAIKYSYANEKSAKRIQNIQINSRIDRSGNRFLIDILNYGLPIPADKTEDIFINGVRTNGAISQDPTGKGFGLALVKQILNNHASEIKVTKLSNPTTFTIFLPFSLKRHMPLK